MYTAPAVGYATAIAAHDERKIVRTAFLTILTG